MTKQLAVYELDSLYDGKYAIDIKVFPYADGSSECELYFDNEHAFTVELKNSTQIVKDLEPYFYDAVQAVYEMQQEAWDASDTWNQC